MSEGSRTGSGAPFLWGYNTNGFLCHDLPTAIELLAELGYDGVALTLDRTHLDPLRAGDGLIEQTADLLKRLRLEVVIETGGRYVLDPCRKHWPTLLDDPPESERRLDLLVRSLEIGSRLGATVLSFWSGKAPLGVSERVLRERLQQACLRLADAADRNGLRLAIEPEPEMWIERVDETLWLLDAVGEVLGVTVDVGHLYCVGEIPAGPVLRRVGERLYNVHLDDVRRGVHEHRAPGEGDVDFVEALQAVGEVGYRGMVSLEMSRSSHVAPCVARSSLEHLRRAWSEAVVRMGRAG